MKNLLFPFIRTPLHLIGITMKPLSLGCTALILAALCLASCKTAEQNARLAELVKLSVSIAESRGAITSQDAADIRAAETIVIHPAAVIADPAK